MEEKKIIGAYTRSQKRKEKKEFNSIIELIEIFSNVYLKTYSTIKINSPFGDGEVTIGKFDNSGKKPLQLKLSSSGGIDGKSGYPGTNSKGDKWMTYETWVDHLDQIDSIDRDYYIDDNLGFFSIKKASQIKNNADFEILISKIDEYEEKLEIEKGEEKGNNNDKLTKKIEELQSIAEEVNEKGTLKKRLAEKLIACLSWEPKEDTIDYGKVEDIPSILSGKIEDMKKDLKLSNELQPEQARAADSLFFVAVCENFRTPGSLKYMRSCLRHLIKENLTFKKVFNNDITKKICTLSPKNGTKITRECIETGNLERLSPKQKAPYESLSESSEDEIEVKVVRSGRRN